MDTLKTQRAKLQRNTTPEAVYEQPGFASAVLDTVGALVIVLDRAGRIVSFNRACQEMTGYTFEEVAGKCFWDLFLIPEEVEPVKAVFNELRSGQFPNRYENYWLTRDGSRRLIAWSNTALLNDSGTVEYVIGTGIDISERKRVEAEIERRRQESEALNKISQSVTATLDLQETLTLVTDHTTRLLGVSATSVALYDEDRGDLWFAAASGAGAEYMLGRRLAMGQGIAGWVAEHGEALMVPDVSRDPRFYDQFDRQSGFTTTSILCVPLKAKRQTIGVIEVMNKEGTAFDQEDLRLLRLIAIPAATAIDNARLFESEVRRRYEAETLREATAALASTLDLNNVLDSILAHLEQVVPYDSACVFLQEGNWLRAVAGKGFPAPDQIIGREYPADDALYAEIQRTVQPVILADAQADPRFQRWGGTDYTRGWMGVPLVVRGEIIGYLSFDSRRYAAYGEAEAALAQAFAVQAAAAIQNARLFEQVRAGRERLKALSLQLVEVQEDERRHIARELHDEIGQLLTGLKLSLDMCTRLPADEARTYLDEARELVSELIARGRELSLDLRPAMLDDLGLLPALLWHFERYTTQTGVRVNFEHTGLERRFSPQVETAAYRIIQEALTNVARHAGVDEVTIRLWSDQETLRLHIEDRGVGFEPEAALAASASSGLAGMQERAALVGGHLAIESTPGAGTRLRAEMPAGVVATQGKEHDPD
ncbi:MAG: GAF domain-containing protein [Anaerolineae bacterium]